MLLRHPRPFFTSHYVGRNKPTNRSDPACSAVCNARSALIKVVHMCDGRLIDAWLRRFPARQLAFIHSEQLQTEPKPVMEELFRFIGLPLASRDVKVGGRLNKHAASFDKCIAADADPALNRAVEAARAQCELLDARLTSPGTMARLRYFGAGGSDDSCPARDSAEWKMKMRRVGAMGTPAAARARVAKCEHVCQV